MVNNLMTLLKAEMMNRFKINAFKYETDTRKKSRTIGLIAAFAIVFIMMAVYCFAISYVFGYMGMSYVVPGYAITITSIITLLFTFLKTNGILFSTRDYDMLMALPIRTDTIITSKFLSMYINNLALAIFVMVPMCIGYAIWTPFSIIASLNWILGILVSPLLPMTIAAILGTIIIGIGSGFKHKVMAQVIITLIIMTGFIVLNIALQKNVSQDEAALLAMLTDIGGTISRTIHQIYPLSAWFDNAVNNIDILPMILLVAISVVIYAAFALICGKYYRKINSALKSHHAASNYKVETMKSSSILSALVYKEWKHFTSSSIYMLNIGMGLILALIISFLSIFTGIDRIIQDMNIASTDVVMPIITNIMPFAIAMLVNMCNTGCVSLSLEGQNIWIMQSLPIGRKTILKGKMLFNIILVLPVSIICNVIFIFELKVSALMAIVYLIFAATSVLMSTAWGVFINVHFPNYQWESEVQVIKQGLSSMIGIFSCMIIFIIMGGLSIALKTIIPGELIIAIFSALTGILAIIIYKTLMKGDSIWSN